MSLRQMLLAWCFFFASVLRAGPSFVTDDPEVTPLGGWEINIPFTLDRTPDTTSMQTPLLDLNYGLPEIQLEFDVPVAAVQNDHHGTVAGLSDILLGVKWRFFEDEHSQIQLATYPQVLTPTGDPQRGLGNGRPFYELPLLAERTWEKWTIYGNIGYWLQPAPGEKNYWYAGAVLQHDINGRLTLGAELFGNTVKESRGCADIAFNIGGTWKLAAHLNLLFTAGRDISGDTRAWFTWGCR